MHNYDLYYGVPKGYVMTKVAIHVWKISVVFWALFQSYESGIDKHYAF